jgi:hypothetical protein
MSKFPLPLSFLLSATIALTALGSLGACANTGGLGASCDSNSECASDLQCVQSACVPKCQRASECGDGFACSSDGYCLESTGQNGSSCDSETDCAAGLACLLDKGDDNRDGALGATCSADKTGHAIGHACTQDGQCRNGTCALGRCIDLCGINRDCPLTMECVAIPRIEASGAMFRGCLPERALLTWDIPVLTPSAVVLVPVPSSAQSLSLAMAVSDDSQLVGAKFLRSPKGDELFDRTKSIELNPLRHRPLPIFSVLQIPSGTAVKLETGAYELQLSSMRVNGSDGSATPRLKASVRTGSKSDTALLQLHFHFLDLSQHPCSEKFDENGRLNATIAPELPVFRDEYVNTLRAIFAGAGVALASPTYDDLTGAASLDNVTSTNLRAVLAMGKYKSGINVFFVRSLSPAGIPVVGPTPGTAGLVGSPASGIVISLEPLCYQGWSGFARTTAHQLARYMGLYPTKDLSGLSDAVSDTGNERDNLMYFSEGGGTKVTAGQRSVLVTSPAVEGSPQ